MKRPTLAQIGKLTGFSHVTVSMALRGNPRISAATRQKIQAVAQKIGYRADPMLSALVSYRRQIKTPVFQATLGWINTHTPSHAPIAAKGNQFYWKGASTRALELGYKLDEIRLSDFGMSLNRLARALHARNIQGLILAPQKRGKTHLKMDWENFSAVSLGYSLAYPGMHVVATAQFRCGVIAMRALRALGYRRIGCVLKRNYDERTDHNFSAAYLREQQRLTRDQTIPLFIYEDLDALKDEERLKRWFRQGRPEVILSQDYALAAKLQGMGISLEECPVALLAISEEWTESAGIVQNETLVGRTAVDMLVGMMHRNERGIPAVPLRTLVEGRWENGGHIPKIT
jgi:DNA-binding LacI/PurR family transcriptional regulator